MARKRHARAVGWLLVVLSLPCAASDSGRALPAETTPATTSPGRLALLIGINEYRSKSIPPLNGCINDVQALKSVLLGEYGFGEYGIRVLTNQEATHARIIQEFRDHLIAKAGPGDVVVFR